MRSGEPSPSPGASQSVDGDVALTPVAREFCAFLVSASDLHREVDSFFDERCEEFHGSSLDGEHKLEWTSVHRQYISLVEQHLESFLVEHATTAEDLCASLETALGGSIWSLPLLRSLEYQPFFAQMIARAAAPMLRAEAEASVTFGSFSGVWKLSPDRCEQRSLDRFLRAQGMPWILRRLHVFAAPKELCIVEKMGSVPTFTFLMSRTHGFGVSMEHVVADGKERGAATSRTTGWLEAGELHVAVRSPSRDVHVAGAVDAHVDRVLGIQSQYSLQDDGKYIRCLRRVLFEGDSAGREVSYAEWFVRPSQSALECTAEVEPICPPASSHMAAECIAVATEVSTGVLDSVPCGPYSPLRNARAPTVESVERIEVGNEVANGALDPLPCSPCTSPTRGSDSSPIVPCAPPGARRGPAVRRLRPAPS